MVGTEYHKINSVYMRDEKTKKFVEGQYSMPELEYLKDNVWVFTEKVNGTNIRIIWENLGHAGMRLRFGGKTDDAQISTHLYNYLTDTFTVDKFKALYPTTPMVIYGEGYGSKVNAKDGLPYIDGVNFVVFDVFIGGLWLERKNVEDIASKLGLKVVPIIGEGTIAQAVDLCKKGFKSQWGDFTAEGIVLRTKVNLMTRRRERIITKVKYKDFSHAPLPTPMTEDKCPGCSGDGRYPDDTTGETIFCKICNGTGEVKGIGSSRPPDNPSDMKIMPACQKCGGMMENGIDKPCPWCEAKEALRKDQEKKESFESFYDHSPEGGRQGRYTY